MKHYDGVGQQIGSEPILPYLSPQLNGQKLLVGANFASAGIGILNDTGIQFVNHALLILFIYLYTLLLKYKSKYLVQIMN